MVMKCNYCGQTCIRKGIRKTVQKYLCRDCGKYQQQLYIYKKLNKDTVNAAVRLTKEDLGISSVARILVRSKSTIQRILFKSGSYLLHVMKLN